MAGNNFNEQEYTIIWADSEVNNGEENLMAQQQLYNNLNNVEIFADGDECQNYIQTKSTKSVFLIVSGRLSRKIIPAISSLQQVLAFYIYCMNKTNHEEWAKQYPKIKGVIINFKELISKIKSDMKTMRQTKPLSTSSSSTSLKDIFPQPLPNSVDEVTDTFQATSINKSHTGKSSHLDGYEKSRLVSLDEAIVPLTSLIEDVEQMVYIVKHNAQSPTDSLTNDESASIAIYTMEWYPKEKSFFYFLNKALISEDPQQMKNWFLYLKLLFTALSKLKTVKSIIYQGINEDLSAKYTKDKIFTTWELLICTAAIKTLEDEETFGKTGRRTLLTIESHSGKNIRQHADNPDKDQVLLLPGRQFKVTSCLIAGDQLYMVQLTEMPSLYNFP